MGLLNKIGDAIAVASEVILPHDPEPLTDAMRDDIYTEKMLEESHRKTMEGADNAAIMQLLAETEDNPLIEQKLLMRIEHGTYEWRDLYEDADKELERIKRLRYSN